LRTGARDELIAAATDSTAFLSAIQRACRALIAAEPELTRQDQIAGDGDAGLTLEAGAKGVLKAIEQGKIQGKNVIEDIGVIAEVVEDDMGGTSGALYSYVLATPLLQDVKDRADPPASSLPVWADHCVRAPTVVRAAQRRKYGPRRLLTRKRPCTSVRGLVYSSSDHALTSTDTRARPPSRTLVDPLDAFTASLPSKGLHAAAEDALAAAEKTKELVAKAGRGAYVNQEELKKREVPDPGAWGVWRILDGLRGYEA
jgi:dihydroxyacetone kinase